MTGDLGLNRDVRLGKKRLHIQTSYSEETGKIVVEVFDGGKLVLKKIATISESPTQPRIKEEVQNFTDFVISDLELVFSIANKVRQAGDIEAIKRLGQIFLAKGFYDEAVEHFRLAQKLEPGKKCCSFELGQALFEKGDYEGALEELQQAAELNPNYPDVLLLLGRTCWKMKQYDLGIRQLQRAVTLNPDYHQAYFLLGRYLIESTLVHPGSTELAPPVERIKEGTEFINRASHLSKEYDRTLIRGCLEKLHQQGHIEEALKDLDEAWKNVNSQVQGSLESEFYIRFLFADLDRDSKALDHYIETIEKSLERHSNYADLHHSLGMAYLIKGWHCFAKSTEAFRKSVEINPAFERAKKNLKLVENEGRGYLMMLRAILR